MENKNHMTRACLKKAFCKMCVTICGRFCPIKGGVVGYANRKRAKYTAKWGVQIAGMIFQTRSSTINAIENNIDHNIQGAIFDVDGTLLDSMPVWEDIGERYLISLGIMAKDGLGDVLHTMSLEQGAVYLKEEYRLEKTVPQIVKEVLKIVSDFYRFEAPLKPGVKETLEWMSKQQIRMVIATSGNKELVEAALDRNGILKYFEQIYTCTEVGAGKDEPEIYLKAAETLQAKPENIVAFEDAFHAAETAKKAGFKVIGVYDASNEENISRMRDVCDCYYDRMDEGIKYN